MNFQQMVVEQLTQFVSHNPQVGEVKLLNGEIQPGYLISVSAADGRSAIVTAADYDQYSIVLRQLKISGPKPVKKRLGLADYAQNVVDQVTYLEEALSVVEIDPAKDVAQLRSHPPQQVGETITYWETIVHTLPQPRLTFARYHWVADPAHRVQLEHPLTFDTLGRIAADLEASLAQKSG